MSFYNELVDRKTGFINDLSNLKDKVECKCEKFETLDNTDSTLCKYCEKVLELENLIETTDVVLHNLERRYGLEVAQGGRKSLIKKLLDDYNVKGIETLTVPVYQVLMDNNFTKKEIREALNIPNSRMYRWINDFIGGENEMDKTVEKKELTIDDLTVERFDELKEKGYSDMKVAKKYNATMHYFNKWKQQNIGFAKVDNKVDNELINELKSEIKRLKQQIDKANDNNDIEYRVLKFLSTLDSEYNPSEQLTKIIEEELKSDKTDFEVAEKAMQLLKELKSNS